MKVGPIKGRTITDVREMTPAEYRNEGWEKGPWDTLYVLVLDDGTKLYASRDPEGNGPGCMFGSAPDGTNFYVNEDAGNGVEE